MSHKPSKRCIFCGSDSSKSKNVAHVMPEGFLANDICLPLGAECDNCNQYLSGLESAFIHHNRIWAPIFLGNVPGKQGLRKELGHFQRTEDSNKIRIKIRIPVSSIERNEEGVHIKLPDSKPYDDLKFRRMLHGIGLRYVAMKWGVEEALCPQFDNVRRYVRRAKRGESWPYAQVLFGDDHIRRDLSLRQVKGAPGLTVRLVSFIDDFYADLLNTGQLHAWAKEALPQDVALA